jgi:hypothetical protein
MDTAPTSAVQRGVVLGILAGIVTAAVALAGAAAMHAPPGTLFHYVSSVLLGRKGLLEASLPYAVFTATALHVALSAFYGAVYGLLAGALDAEDRASYRIAIPLGLLYGFVVWLINTQLVADALYPWIALAPALPLLLLHMFAYGLPLALMTTRDERASATAVTRAEAPA